MSYYKKCHICGANLDHGEKCDCQKYTYHALDTKGGSHVVVMEVIEGETPIDDKSEVYRDFCNLRRYIVHIVRPEDRIECFSAIVVDETEPCEVLYKLGDSECICEIDHQSEIE